MWSATRFCDYYQVATSSPSVLRCGPRGRALIDQHESGVRANMKSIANRGVGGMNGRLRARASTAGGKIAGRAWVRRANDFRLRSACSACQLDIRLPPVVHGGADG